ncbi:MAG: class I SAM-dependent methyltransferase [Candidatus Paceibacterota bacterium]|jgi:predicted O-methyltransferase YrrM
MEHKYRKLFDEALLACVDETHSEEALSHMSGEFVSYMNNTVGSGLYYKFFKAFTRLAKPKVIVELGNREGAGLCSFWGGLTEPDQEIHTFDVVPDLRFVGPAIKEDQRVKIYINDVLSPEAYQLFDTKSIDVLFCDTIHTADQLSKEWAVWSPRLAEQAIVFIDDINLEDKITAFRAINQERLEMTELHASGFGVVFFKR